MTHRLSKRTILIALIGLAIVVAAGVYTHQSIAAWKSYETRLLREQSEYETLRDAALRGKTQSDRLAAIRTLDDKLDKRGDLCAMTPVFAWQAVVIPPLRDGVQQCEKKVRQLDAIAPPLSALREYLDTAETLQKALSELSPRETLSESNWVQNGLQKAKDVQSAVKNMPGTSKELTSQAEELTNALVQAWQALIRANETQDKTAYITASANVLKAYANLAGLADTVDTEIAKRVQAVTQAASSL